MSTGIRSTESGQPLIDGKPGFESILSPAGHNEMSVATQCGGNCDSSCDCYDCDFNCEECDGCDCDM